MRSALRGLQLPAGAIIATNRGYVDYLFLDSLTEKVIFFVTRLKDNAVFSLAEVWSEPRENILADDLIDLPGSGKSHHPQRQLRRVVVWERHNFKIKTFVGTSANAVRIQIWTALIDILLLKLLQLRSRIDWSP